MMNIYRMRLYCLSAISFFNIASAGIFDSSKCEELGIKKGIYSGTFDPPTKAHNFIIRGAINNLHLEKLYVFVNTNGEKDYKCSSKERVEMLQSMLKDLGDKVIIIAQTADNKRSDYLMIKKILNEKLVNITGEDSYTRRILVFAGNRTNFDAIAIVPRNNKSSSAKVELEENAFYLPIDAEKLSAVSSTNVRKQLYEKNFKDIALTPEVLSYIIENGLYGLSGECKKEKYLNKYYTFIGQMFAPFPAPEFDPSSSEDSWYEKFYKWVRIHHHQDVKVIINEQVK
jgi:nicotinic acid mononucleotide adenylyltransferase